MIKPRIGFYVVYEPAEESWQDWEIQSATITRLFQAQGLEVIPAPQPVMSLKTCEQAADWFASQKLDLLHALIASWSFDHYSIEIQNRTGLPLAVRSLPGLRSGSLVAGQQLNCVLADLESEHRLFFGPVDSAEAAYQTALYARACAVKRSLHGARMAVVGRRTEGMTPTAIDEVEVLRRFGIRILNYGLDEIQEMRERIPMAQAESEWRRISQGAITVTSSQEHGIETTRNYLLLKQMQQELGLSALTIGSYPQCQGTMCLPIALLNDEGLPTGCEGDVNSTISMLILSLLGNGAVHFGEMLDVNLEQNTIVSSHCGCGSFSLAGEGGYVLCPVRLANSGVCVRYAAKPGPVTYINLVGRKGNYRLCAFEGDAIPAPMEFEGNPLTFRLKSPFRKIWRLTADGGFGHHWMTIYSHVVPELVEYCKVAGITGVFPDLEQA